MSLAENWAFRLRRVGLEVRDCLGLRQEFKRLNADLVIDDAMRDYAASNWQVIEETKRFLCAGELPKEEPKPELSDYDKHLESHVMASVPEHFKFDRELDSSGAGVGNRDFPVQYPTEHRGSRSLPHR